MSDYYHYTNTSGAQGIRDSGLIHCSGQSGSFGPGVYLTDLEPNQYFRDQILQNNYGGIADKFANRADWVVRVGADQISQSQLQKVNVSGAPDRRIYVYPNDIEVDRCQVEDKPRCYSGQTYDSSDEEQEVKNGNAVTNYGRHYQSEDDNCDGITEEDLNRFLESEEDNCEENSDHCLGSEDGISREDLIRFLESEEENNEDYDDLYPESEEDNCDGITEEDLIRFMESEEDNCDQGENDDISDAIEEEHSGEMGEDSDQNEEESQCYDSEEEEEEESDEEEVFEEEDGGDYDSEEANQYETSDTSEDNDYSDDDYYDSYDTD